MGNNVLNLCLLISILSWVTTVQAGLEDCGIDPTHQSIIDLDQCKSSSSSAPAGKTLECYFNLYKKSLKRISKKNIYERSPLMRDLLSIHRQNFGHSDEENKILDYYETTELYLQILECSTGQGPICIEDRDDLVTYAKEAIPEAIDLQSNHHAIKIASSEIKRLMRILPEQTWPTGLASRKIRSDYYPQAIKDCEMGLPPGRYPPPRQIEKQQREKKRSLCPDFMADISQNSCDKPSASDSRPKDIETSLLFNQLFQYSIKKQLTALSSHLASIPISKQEKKQIIDRANKEISKCTDQFISPKDAERIFPEGGNYFIDRNIKMIKAVRSLTYLNDESKHYGDQFNQLITEHKRRCFFSPLSENAPYFSLKIFTKDHQASNCSKSEKLIKDYQKKFILPLARKIHDLRTQFPELSIPVSGEEIEVTNTCFKGRLNHFYHNPLQYIMYGKMSGFITQQDLLLDSKDISSDSNCGVPAWSLGKTFGNQDFPEIRDYKRPSLKINTKAPFSSFLNQTNLLNEKEHQFHNRLVFINEQSQKEIPTKDITLVQSISQKIDQEISENLINNFTIACEDPIAYGESMLPVDKIIKEFFEQNENNNLDKKKLFCDLRHQFIKNKKYKQDAYLAASIGIGVIGMMNPVASAIAFPIEMGIEYHQWKQHQRESQTSLALSLLGLDDYEKINISYEGLQNTEIALYAALALNTLGSAGDVLGVLSQSQKMNRHYKRLVKLLKPPLNNKKEKELVDRVTELMHSDVPDAFSREMIIDILEEAKRKGIEGRLANELYNDISPLKEIAVRHYKKNLTELLKETDAAELIPEILKLEDYELLKKLNRKIDMLSEVERKKFAELLLRRQVCTISDPSDCIFLALSEFANQYDARRTLQAKQFWRLYKNDTQFYTYLEQQLRKRNLGNRYEQINKEILEIRGELPENSFATKAMESFTDNINRLPTDRLQELGADALEEISTKSTPSRLNPTLTNYQDPFSQMDNLSAEILAIADEYNNLPLRVRSLIPRAPPKEISLDLPFLKSKQVPATYIKHLDPRSSHIRNLQEYEGALMSLRSGDTIRISSNGSFAPERTLQVGEYLGMGNSSHVFSITLETGEEAVLKLPGNVDELVTNPDPKRFIYQGREISPNGQFIDQRSQLTNRKKVSREASDKGYISFRQNRQFVERAKSVQCQKQIARKMLGPCYYTVKILESDPNYRYTIVEKIDVITNGEDFVKDNLISIIQTEYFGLGRSIDDLAEMTGENTQTINQQLNQYRRLKEVLKIAKEHNVPDLHEGQLVWAKRPDTGELDWILADW